MIFLLRRRSLIISLADYTTLWQQSEGYLNLMARC
ncbi:hypothetical protein NEOC65_000624 [Neochlamydia sp. AcF65]|nr:hypothetical protein [Neochlamydia sp. AcF65]